MSIIPTKPIKPVRTQEFWNLFNIEYVLDNVEIEDVSKVLSDYISNNYSYVRI